MIPILPILLAWIPISASFFAVFKPLKAVALAYLIGYLLLPIDEVNVKGFWDIDKILVTNFGVLFGTVLFCPQELRRYRFHLADVFIVLTCLSELTASINNGLGIYDGASRFMFRFFFYASPYFAGRIFIQNKADLVQIAQLIVVAAGFYAFLALWEFRMSPQSHLIMYGSFQHSFAQHKRWIFFRPVLFFPHALALGVFFAWSSFLGIWLYWSRQLPRSISLPAWLVTFAPMVLIPLSTEMTSEITVVVTVACLGWVAMMMTISRSSGTIKLPGWLVVSCPVVGLVTSMSVGPMVIFATGLGLLVAWDYMRSKWIPFIPMIFVLTWMVGRYTGVTDGKWLVDSVYSLSERAGTSLGYRVRAEDLILDHAREHPIFGWGTWGRNRIIDDRGKNVVAIDGMWLNIVSTTGLAGLVCFFLWWCWPMVMLAGMPGDIRGDPVVQVTLIAIAMQAVNFMFNGFLSPVLSLLVGCSVTILSATTLARRRSKSETTMPAVPIHA